MSDSANGKKTIRLAISTCPNDTFAFHAIMERKVDLRGLEFQISLLDIQELNDGLFADRFDVAKASFHAAIHLANQWIVLPSGSALGFGVGPLLLAARPDSRPDRVPAQSPTLTLCPGELTTATMLFKLFYGPAISQGYTRISQCLFSDIMPMLQSGSADYGVCIHEGRFTWRQEGLNLVEDLGSRWENETGSPLPLGGILARRDLSHDTIQTVQDVIQESIEYGLNNREQTMPTMRAHAQELSDQVLLNHVHLYVNDWTIDLGIEGRNALKVLAEKATTTGLVNSQASQLEVWE